jgi:hypothetical protein
MSTVAEAWGLIDHALVRLKTTELAQEMHKSIKAEENQIRFDNRHNQNSQAVPSLLLPMHERRIDEHIEKTYELYCEVWEKQGYPKTAEFVRAISAHVVPVIIGARKGAVIAQLSMERARTAGLLEPHKARIASFEQSMQRLAAHWARKLEIEARESEHAGRLRHSKQKGSFDQRENLAKGIAGRKAEIERINRVLDNLPSPSALGPYGKPIQVGQKSISNLIQRRIEHEAGLSEMEREQARLCALERRATEEQCRDPEQSEQVPAPAQTQPASAVNPVTYRTPYEGLKPAMKVVDFSNFMVAAKLTDKQFDCYSLVKEYKRPMNEVEQRMGITRKTIHEHIEAAEKAMRRLGLRESRSKAAAKRHNHD